MCVILAYIQIMRVCLRVGNINSYIACVYERGDRGVNTESVFKREHVFKRGSTKPHSPQPLGIWVLPPVYY